MSLVPLIKQLESARVEIINDRPKEAKRITLDVLALVKRRIQQRGESATGEPFDGYSEAVVPYWYFNAKNVVASAKDKLKKKGYHVSYKDFREANNRQTRHYDATLTGETMRGMHVFNVSNDDKAAIVEIKHRADAGRKKNEWQDKRNKRPLFEPSDKELDFAAKASEQRVLNIFKKNNII